MLGLQIICMTNGLAEKVVDWKLFVCETGQPGSFSLDTLNAMGKDMIPGYEQVTDHSDALGKVENYLDGAKDKISKADDFQSFFTAFMFNGNNGNVLNSTEQEKLDKLAQLCLNRASSFLVYRIAFANFLFFALMAVIMINVKSSSDPRSGIQNGFWGIKFVLILGTAIGCLFIQEGTLDGFLFVIGLISAILFILWQLILLVDFAHGANEWLLEKMDDDDLGQCAKGAMIALSFGQYLAALVGIILLYIYFGPSGCSLHQFYISMALILSVICGIVATNGEVQDSSPSSGILQAAVVSLYCVYMTYTALASNYDTEYTSCTPYDVKPASEGRLQNGSSIFSMLLAVVIVLYSTISSATKGLSGTGDSDGSRSSDIPMLEAGESTENGKVQDDEANSVQYNYSMYHTTMIMAALYMMMLLTNWQNPNNKDLLNLANMWPVIWIKVVSAWASVLLYLWTLIAPMMFPDRF